MLDGAPAMQAEGEAAEERQETLAEWRELQDTVRLASARAREAEGEAAEMRAVALQLAAAVEHLSAAFTPIWRVHGIDTWEGRSASLSRVRLGDTEGRCAGAVRSIDAIVGDLESEALRQDSVALAHWRDHSAARLLSAELLDQVD